MTIAFTDEHLELRAVVREFLVDRSPESEVRRLMDSETGFDAAVWSQLGAELGLCGLAVPEEHGGAGYTLVEVGIVVEELGRSLACLPYLSSVVLGQGVLLAADDDTAAKRWLPGLAAGELRAAAGLGGGGPWRPESVTVTAECGRLSGSVDFVIDGASADVVFLAANDGNDGISVYAVESGATGMHRENLSTIDLTRRFSRIELDGAEATPVGGAGRGAEIQAAVADLAAVALAVESVGAAGRVLEMATEYARTRVQFGRAIGSFQAIKHRCAEMLVDVETARSAAYQGLFSAGSPESPEVASLAKAYCTDAFVGAATANIQIHGGTGFTWEHPAHLYYRRARANHLLFGDSDFHREQLLRRMDL